MTHLLMDQNQIQWCKYIDIELLELLLPKVEAPTLASCRARPEGHQVSEVWQL